MDATGRPTGRPQKRDPIVALRCAEAFQRSAEKCIPSIPEMERGSLPPSSVPGRLGDLVVCATNLSFAIELYLKALLVQLNCSFKPCHDLHYLYSQMPGRVRATMESVYDAFGRKQLLAGALRSITLAKGAPDEPSWDDYTKTSRGLPDLLKRSKDLFQSWRYIFEFSPLPDAAHEFFVFEYDLLWCAAETMRAETTIRLGHPEPCSDGCFGGHSPISA